MKRVVITGLGIISSIGNNHSEVLRSLQHGLSGINFSKELEESGMRSHIWGGIKLHTEGLINRKIVRFMSDASIYAYLSMQQAIQDSELSDEVIGSDKTGLIIGSGGGSPRNQVVGSNNMRMKGLRGVGPYMVTRSMASGISACLATAFKIRGISYSISSACSTSAHCIGHAFELIQSGRQIVVFAGGGEELCWEMACEFDAMGALSTKYNTIPEKASRPYDVNRDGFVISGGGGVVVLEELMHALNRGAYIYGEIIGYGATSDGFDMVAPSGEGAVRCMRIALKDLAIPIDYINMHGTSTQIGDVKELWAILEVFGTDHPYFSSTKSMTGHALGAAGVHETIYSMLMLKYNFIAPSINIDQLDPYLNHMKIVRQPVHRKLNTVMTNSFGFGGTNATLVIQKYI
ncbi:3-oxoacyl-[acyl-carrier-protein] synthase 1 [Candidatus Blochmanniella vafra str. BVAF]|uniref:3-oxoacyl-[acyl-carrier-protein] synthase 1 n=1 Tax=Blochmanniella vafra (strain BVAF) TaxID=859654 RepID=E8Q761_BLOVB|nr:beta-ketoacyl-ACP synthase I [Candidatus Blochmannia vafer]ADV33885.1 3-oxoacyl-[acyl-carrier-protein] synthase 1 [Candidatus Blochmannia vafer str. BVAF]